ncbi:DUF484 family protein [Roseinatronobacter bogoriensis]|jgi:uncharacterized protein YigA (DUF484 family)|uniref:DUF484 domain-containing protein n=1 Tax=Roseinatronobacter bogoriensis subsp. barguzinensis TaxID=441209 RepID=A0A2K8KBL7_9RHOB|nr:MULTISPECIES: DUF484 family protein [Rhodobaca]ATX66839.1 DUF484 domain-containing protein [Rhodobaca barguzinensis]MBB4206311.1 hypothetical protein [Rhodobaca bogoriensis DSM 18756]TDW41056.1 hypothetical protein LY39_00154 [Rhodobaca barguzinensis]TDY74766.1 hypothetical protein EV660_101810 [Rhodobaca bogoriensis DSM 18756]
MTGTALRPEAVEELRDRILADPSLILDDKDLMRTLVSASERGMGDNIVDLRGLAMERLEARLDRLEETHRAVIAAAYENLSGTNQIHRAILRMLDPDQFEGFLRNLGTDVVQILNVDAIKLVLESPEAGPDPALERISEVLRVVPVGFIETYMSSDRGPTTRQVLLRQSIPQTDTLYGAKAPDLRSEACMRLDLGAHRMAGMLVMATENPHMFKPGQGTDLLAFFAGIFERSMRRWLA